MRRDAFFCKFNTGSEIKKISSRAVYGADYSPQIITPPNLSLEGAGYIKPGYEEMVIRNNPADKKAVFNWNDQSYPPAHKPYEIECMWGLQGAHLFEGSALLKKPKAEQRPLVLAPKEFTLDALEMIDAQTVRSRCFGTVTHRIPVKLSASTYSNPFFDLTKTIRFYENGVEIGNNIASDPNEFTTAPTASTITLNGTATGEVSCSGVGVEGETLLSFFQYIVSELSLSLEYSSKAPNAGSVPVGFWVNSQIKLIDLADQVAQAFNYQFVIGNGVLTLIDKMYEVSETVIQPTEIFEVGAPDYRWPTQGFNAVWQKRVPFSGSDIKLGTEDKKVPVVDSVFKLGHFPNYQPFTEDESQIQNILEDRLSLINQGIFSVTKRTIDLVTTFGDKLKYIDPSLKQTVVQKVRKIKYNFSLKQTTFTGEGVPGPLQKGI